MTTMKSSITALLAVATAFALAQAAPAAQLGDPAAPLKITEWTKGKSVDLAAAKGKQIVVVEFWATWCPPCRASIPHLTELQKKFPDVAFVGVSDEDADVVKKFVTKMGDQMDYTVAVDKDQQTSDGYMKAYGIDSIPHAFIVGKDGNILWEGHPMDGLDEALQQVIAGKYDITKAKKMAAAKAKLQQFVELATNDDKDPKLEPLGKELVALDKELGGIQPGETFDPAAVLKMIRFQKAVRQYGRAMMADQSQQKLDELGRQIEASAPQGFDLAEFKQDMEARKAFGDYYEAATAGADKDRLAALAQKVSGNKSKDAKTLNQMAMTLLTDENIKSRDYPLATELARASVDASEAKVPAALDTYALALFDSGKTAEAVTWEQKAVAASTTDDERQPLEASLKKYQDAAGK
jgi:thiol-disulfide isomerase/thioredoxin